MSRPTHTKHESSSMVVKFFAAMVRDRAGEVRTRARAYTPKNGVLGVPAGAKLHGRPVATVGYEDAQELSVVFWDDGLEFRFSDGTSQRKSFDELYIEALAENAKECGY